MAHRIALGIGVAALAFGCGGNAGVNDGERARIVAGDTAGTGGTDGLKMPSPPGTPGTGATGGGGYGGYYGGCGGSTSPGSCGGPGVGGFGATGYGGCGGSSSAPTCPATFPSESEPCAMPGMSCVYDVACQSGSVQITLECNGTGWTLVPTACAELHDSCADTTLHCSETGWIFDDETCPDSAPEAGSECSLPGLSCGYPCDPIAQTGWSVGTCSGAGVWEVDAGCL